MDSDSEGEIVDQRPVRPKGFNGMDLTANDEYKRRSLDSRVAGKVGCCNRDYILHRPIRDYMAIFDPDRQRPDIRSTGRRQQVQSVGNGLAGCRGDQHRAEDTEGAQAAPQRGGPLRGEDRQQARQAEVRLSWYSSLEQLWTPPSSLRSLAAPTGSAWSSHSATLKRKSRTPWTTREQTTSRPPNLSRASRAQPRPKTRTARDSLR